MPEGIKFTYKCDICERVFSSKKEEEARGKAEECEKGHDVVYVKLMRSDVERLWNFIFSKDEAVLTETLVNELRKYRRL